MGAWLGLVAGLLLVVAGADALVRGAARTAAALGVPLLAAVGAITRLPRRRLPR